MTWKHFLFGSYWLTQPMTARGLVALYWWVFFLVVTIVGVLCLVIAWQRKSSASALVLKRYGDAGLTMGIVGALFFFFRQEQVFFFAWRIWLLLWLIVLIAWIIPITLYLFQRVPKIADDKRERAMREQYLPKAKR